MLKPAGRWLLRGMVLTAVLLLMLSAALGGNWVWVAVFPFLAAAAYGAGRTGA